MSRLVTSFFGTFAARSGLSLVEMIGILYIARVAGAKTLGTYALFRAMFVLGSLAVDAGIREATIKRIAEGRDEGQLLVASTLVRGLLLVPVVAVIVGFGGWIADYVGSPIMVPYLAALVVLEVFAETVYAGLHGEQRVGRAEFSLFANVAGKVVVWTAALPLGYGLSGVLFGHLVGSALQIAVGAAFLTVRPSVPTRRHVERLTSFGKYSWLGSVRERAWVWTDTIVLGFFVGSGLVGVYELSWQLSAAFFLAPSAISSTLFANVDRLRRQEGTRAVRETLEQSLVYSGVVAIPGLVGAAIVAESLLSMVDPTYAVGAVALVVLIFARLAHSYEVVFAKVINAYDRPDLTFRADVAFIVCNVVGNVIAIATVGWIGAAVATAVSMGVRFLLSYRYLRSLIDVPVPGRAIGLEVLAALLMGGVLLSATGGTTVGAVETVLVILGGAVVYASLLIALVTRIRAHARRAVFGRV